MVSANIAQSIMMHIACAIDYAWWGNVFDVAHKVAINHIKTNSILLI